MHYDMIVIGMGLSGLMAAKTASEAGKKVLIIGKGTGSLCLFSSTIDLLGTLPKGRKMKEGLSEWMKDHPQHPYSKMGTEKIEEALSSFRSLFPPPFSFQSRGDENCLVLTGAGTYRPTYLIPTTMAAGTDTKEGEGLIVGFKGFKDFSAAYVADALGWRGVMLSFPRSSRQEISGTALSRWMENPSFRRDLAGEIKKQMAGETRVGLPALLGMRDPVHVQKDLEEMTGAEVFEIPTLPPSLPGRRIFNHFKKWLIQKGVTFVSGYSVSRASLKGKRCEGVSLSNPPVATFFSGDAYILATGRFIGGGLAADEWKISEPIFRLPVFQPPSRENWFGNSFFNDPPHPIHQSGILTDEGLRPVDERGERVLDNLWIAGSILSHHRSVEEKSREGIEIATGYMAAKQAIAQST